MITACGSAFAIAATASSARDGDGDHVFLFHCLLHPGQAVLAE